MVGQLAELKAEVAEARAGLVVLEEAFGNYRSEFITYSRLSAVGETFEVLESADGRTFEEAVVRSVDAVGLVIRHRNGSARIPYQLLPSSLQSRFQWNVGEAQVALNREAKQNAERNRQSRIAYERMEDRRKIAAEEAMKSEERRLLAERSRVASLYRETSSTEGADGSLTPRAPGNGISPAENFSARQGGPFVGAMRARWQKRHESSSRKSCWRNRFGRGSSLSLPGRPAISISIAG